MIFYDFGSWISRMSSGEKHFFKNNVEFGQVTEVRDYEIAFSDLLQSVCVESAGKCYAGQYITVGIHIQS